MERDFTAEAQQELLALVREVEDEKWSNATDWIGDRFIGLRQLVGELSIDNYLSRMNQYHKLVIDKENATEATINDIFKKVYNVDYSFVSRFAACATRLDNYVSLINLMADTIDPVGSVASIASLSAAFDGYEQQDKALAQIVTNEDGLSREILEVMDADTRQTMIDHIFANLVDMVPGLEVEGTIEVPLGVNMVLYYSVESSLNGGDDSFFDLGGELTYGIEEGKARFKDRADSVTLRSSGYEIEAQSNHDGEDSLAVDDGKHQYKIGSDGDASIGSSWEYNGVKYSYEFGAKFNEYHIEKSVEVETEHGSVTSTAGIRWSDKSGWEPVPIPAYEPAPVSVPAISQPELREVAVTGAQTAVILGTIAIIAGIALAPATGGGSLALCVL